MNLQERVEKLVSILDKHTPLCIVGSSYGGITALCALLQKNYPENEEPALLLCAPALNRAEEPATKMNLKATRKMVIIHGTRDIVIPFNVSEKFYIDNPGVVLCPTNDNHNLTESYDEIISWCNRLIIFKKKLNLIQ